MGIPYDKFEEEVEQLALSLRLNESLVVHAWDHTLRVVEYSKMIANACFLEIKNDIIVSAYFHDVGRKTDSFEPEHGNRSAKILEQHIPDSWKNIDLESIIFAIRFHQDIKAPNGKEPVVNNYTLPKNTNPGVAKALWDADRLDLFRLKNKRPIILDYLNTNFAKSYANTAEHISRYKE